MFTYDKNTKTLFPNDAFGEHYATTYHMDTDLNQDELDDMFREAKVYFANILTPLRAPITKALGETLKKFPEIKMIAPSHGLVLTKQIPRMLNNYVKWSSGYEQSKVFVLYDSMWGATEQMAHAIYKGTTLVPKVDSKLYHTRASHHTELMTEMFDAPVLALGCPTIHSNILPSIGGFLTYMKSLLPKGHNKHAFVFGSYGWANESEDVLVKALTDIGFHVDGTKACQYKPCEKVLNQCNEIGKQLARKAFELSTK